MLLHRSVDPSILGQHYDLIRNISARDEVLVRTVGLHGRDMILPHLQWHRVFFVRCQGRDDYLWRTIRAAVCDGVTDGVQQTW